MNEVRKQKESGSENIPGRETSVRVETAERCERAGAEEIAESKRDIAAACAETRVSRVWQSKWTQMHKKAGRPDPKKIRN